MSINDQAASADESQEAADEQQRVEQEQENQEAEAKTPATAVLEAAQPFQVEGGEGKVHQMQARHARLALGEAINDAKGHLINAADVRPILRQYPYLAVGSSLAAGFVAAAVLVPSRKQRAASRLRALERAVRAEAAASGKRVAKPSSGGAARKGLGLAWRLARPTLLSLVTGAISGAATGNAAAEPQQDAPPADLPDTEVADVT